jgi:hypothetical protein
VVEVLEVASEAGVGVQSSVSERPASSSPEAEGARVFGSLSWPFEVRDVPPGGDEAEDSEVSSAVESRERIVWSLDSMRVRS